MDELGRVINKMYFNFYDPSCLNIFTLKKLWNDLYISDFFPKKSKYFQFLNLKFFKKYCSKLKV